MVSLGDMPRGEESEICVIVKESEKDEIMSQAAVVLPFLQMDCQFPSSPFYACPCCDTNYEFHPC